MEPTPIDWTALAYSVALVGVVAVALLIVLLFWVFWRVKRINLAPDADFWTALRATPLTVVLLLDLLDFIFDFLSAPLAWAILSRLGLLPLRGVTVIQQLIPGTQLLPVMTTAWVLDRVFDLKKNAPDFTHR